KKRLFNGDDLVDIRYVTTDDLWIEYMVAQIHDRSWIPSWFKFKLPSSVKRGGNNRCNSNGVGSRSLGCWQISYSIFCDCRNFDYKSRICNEYDSVVCHGSNCRSSNCRNAKPYTLLYFPILPDHHEINSIGLGISSWTNWRNTWTNYWRYFTCCKFRFTAKLFSICHSGSHCSICCILGQSTRPKSSY